MNVGTLTISLTARTAALMSSLGKVRTFENGVMATVNRLNRGVAILGQSLSVLSLPLVAIGGLAVKKFADFEYELAKVTGLAGVSADQVQKWSANLLDLSQKTGESAQDLAEALYFVSSSGIKGARVLEVVEVAAYGAMAGLGKAKDTANLITSVMNAYGASNVDAAQTLDVLVAAVREGKAEASDMAKSLGLVVNVASELGISFSNVAAAVAAVTKTGVGTQTAATQLRQLLFSFLKERPMVEKALESMGLTFQQVRDSLSEDLIGGLIKLRAVTSAWGDNALAQVIPNIRAFNEALSLTGVNVLETMRVFDLVRQPTNDFAEAVNAVADTARVKLNQAMQTINNRLISFGGAIADDVIPIMEKFTNFISSLLGWFTSLDNKTQELIITVVALSAALGPVLLVFSSFVTAISSMAAALTTPLGLILAVAAAVYLVGDNFSLWEKAWPRMVIQFATFMTKMELRLWQFIDSFKELRRLFEKIFGKFFGNLLATAVTPAAITAVNLFAEPIEDKLARLQADIDRFEKDLAERPDLQYGFTDALGGSLEKEGSKLLKWVEKFTGEITAKFSALKIPKLNINDGPTTLDFLDYSIDEVDFLLYKKEIDSLIELQKELTEVFGATGMMAGGGIIASFSGINEYLESINKQITQIISDNGDLAAFMNTIPEGIKSRMNPETLAKIIEYSELFSKAVTDAAQRLREYTNSFIDFAKIGDGASDSIHGLIEAFAQLQAKATFPDNSIFKTKTSEQNLQYWTAVRDSMEQLVAAKRVLDKNWVVPQDVIDTWIDANKKVEDLTMTTALYSNLLGNLPNTLQSFGTMLGDIFVGADEPFKKFAQSILQTAGSIIGALLSIALAATTVKMGLVIGLAVGLVAVSAALAAMSKTKEQAANLASGGIIPPGYPNDSFNANLSSNEAVIPLERLPQLMGIGRGSEKRTVEFLIEGRYLKAILDDANLMSKTY